MYAPARASSATGAQQRAVVLVKLIEHEFTMADLLSAHGRAWRAVGARRDRGGRVEHDLIVFSEPLEEHTGPVDRTFQSVQFFGPRDLADGARAVDGVEQPLLGRVDRQEQIGVCGSG